MSECTGTPKWCCGRHDFLRRQGAHFATPSEEKIGIYHNRIQGLERQQAIDQQTIADLSDKLTAAEGMIAKMESVLEQYQQIQAHPIKGISRHSAAAEILVALAEFRGQK